MKKIITYLIIAVVLAGAGYFIWRDVSAQKGRGTVSEVKAENGKDVATATTTATTTTAKPAAKVTETALNVPDFSKITIDPSITGIVKEKLIADIQKVIVILKGNSMDSTAWIQLGILRKNAKDYDGAIAAWEFANTLSPQNSVPLLNIANLYGYYLHDNAKAEEYLKKAIAAEPKDGYAYFKSFEFYTDIKEPAKARAVLEQGVAANSTDTQLKAVLDSLK